MPTRKVSVGAVSGAVVALAFWGLSVFDPSVADKINIGVSAAASTLVGLALSYIIPEKDQAS